MSEHFTISVNGIWGEWTSYSDCAIENAGHGYCRKKRSRECDSPSPSNGGFPCPGLYVEKRPCISCPITPKGTISTSDLWKSFSWGLK